ncbi:unnamed protein product [Pleuronectes platessa]|uniref:Uncharacterized protein n=1 Tax=Pleuronectes platessa TaxID=8262 RepID=A0A9N7UDW7_PLEPL|nr:unnamed protein product [Pleuronectes platessa]
MEVEEQSDTKLSSEELHRHSAPEKLLTSHLQLLQFNSDGMPLEPISSHHPAGEEQDAADNHLHAPSTKWDGSRCSTPGSVFLEGDGDESCDRLDGMCVNGGPPSSVQHHRPWGRSVSVPVDPSGTQGKPSSDQILESDFEPLSAAASVDTLLEEQRAEDRGIGGGKKEEENVEGEATMKKLTPSRNHRRNRRRNERFATNLRNEIQRKKATLQRSCGPGGLLCSGETVPEEEGPDLHHEQEDPDVPAQERSSKVAFASPVMHEDSNTSRSVQVLDPVLPSFGVGIRVVEEPAPAGKARRWRWTPENKLQPEPEQDRRCRVPDERVSGVTGSRHGVCTYTSSSASSTTSSHSRTSSCSRMEDTDILPFADRMKFFEETSKSISGSNVPSLSSRRQKKPKNHPEHQGGELGPNPTQRRYSYQGALPQESSLLSDTMESRRQSVSTSRERQREKEMEREREREERAREREREERLRERQREDRLRERERQQEKERQERELELEKARQRGMQRERDREERMRQWERERERELELEREKEMERLQREREEELQRDREREEVAQLSSRQEFRGKENHQENFQHNFQLQPRAFSQSPAPRSAFHPVCPPSQCFENQQPLQQGHTSRSYTPTETHPARKQDTTTLNRKFSLTERDYPGWRRESRPPESVPQPQQLHHAPCGPGDLDSSNGFSFPPPPAPLGLRGRAMSENDLRFDSSHRWSPSVCVGTNQTLREVEEGAGGEAASTFRQSRKKTPPPPRPPPPKWEQFHRRRASHHTLFSSTAPPSIPPSVNTARDTMRLTSLLRRRPGRDGRSDLWPRPRERGRGTCRARMGRRWRRRRRRRKRRWYRLYLHHRRDTSRSSEVHDHERTTEKQQHNVRPGAEWERSPSPRAPSESARPPGGENGVPPPESYFAIDYERQQQQESSSV